MKIKIVIIVVGIAIAFSGCTGNNDITSAVKALPEVQQILNEHPRAKITTTYWSKEDAEKSVDEISKQCDKTISPVAMYKATVSEGELKFISWINADTQIVICSVTQGSGDETKQPASTSIQYPMVNDTEINQISVKVDPKNFNTTGRMNLSLKITNPRINETVITLFSTEFIPQWSDESTITIIKNHTWTRNYSVPAKNTSYIKMVVEVSENNSVVKMAKWNITGWAPAGG